MSSSTYEFVPVATIHWVRSREFLLKADVGNPDEALRVLRENLKAAWVGSSVGPSSKHGLHSVRAAVVCTSHVRPNIVGYILNSPGVVWSLAKPNGQGGDISARQTLEYMRKRREKYEEYLLPMGFSTHQNSNSLGDLPRPYSADEDHGSEATSIGKKRGQATVAPTAVKKQLLDASVQTEIQAGIDYLEGFGHLNGMKIPLLFAIPQGCEMPNQSFAVHFAPKSLFANP
jgi:hypothetical protein